MGEYADMAIEQGLAELEDEFEFEDGDPDAQWERLASMFDRQTPKETSNG